MKQRCAVLIDKDWMAKKPIVLSKIERNEEMYHIYQTFDFKKKLWTYGLRKDSDHVVTWLYTSADSNCEFSVEKIRAKIKIENPLRREPRKTYKLKLREMVDSLERRITDLEQRISCSL